MCVYELIAIAISFNLFPLAVRLPSMRQRRGTNGERGGEMGQGRRMSTEYDKNLPHAYLEELLVRMTPSSFACSRAFLSRACFHFLSWLPQ
jgi:hypothetical protein